MEHLSGVDYTYITEQEMLDFSKYQILHAMTTAEFHLAFPYYIVEDIMLFAKEQVAESRTNVLIGIKTKSNGAVIFNYNVGTSDKEIFLTLDSYYVPKTPSDIPYLKSVSGKCLIIDISK